MVPNYAEGTIAKYVKRARQIYKSAIRKGLVNHNPFSEVSSDSEQNGERLRFIDQETIAKVLQACPDVQWRVIVALARSDTQRNLGASLGRY